MEIFQDNDKKDFRVNEEEQLKPICSITSQGTGKYEANEDVLGLQNELFVGCEASKSAQELYFDSESSCFGAKRDIPWWRTADTEELALLVAQKSLGHIENCDLPRPQTAHVKKELDANIPSFFHDGNFSSSLDSKPSTKNRRYFSTCIDKMDSSTQKHKILADPLVPTVDKPLSPTFETIHEMREFKNNASKAQLLEAVRYSQTRARQAEEAAKQARAEKEHLVKLVFRQASQIFAYKQWLQILQLENDSCESVSRVFPIMLPQRTRKMLKSGQNRNRAERSCPKCRTSKYAVVLAFGMGLVSAGLILGWTVGLMIPTCCSS